MKNRISLFTKWVKNNRLEAVGLLLIFLLAAFFRFYRLPDYMTFLGDEGRDALVVKHLLIDHHLPFIGPPTSVGNMYLGPLYYYMMAIPMAIFWLNPVAAAAMVGVLGVLTVGLLYYLGRAWFGPFPAIVTALIYAISPVTIFYSRSSWNPNPAPFFTLLAIIGFYWAHKSKEYLWLVLVGAAFAFLIQMHYLALIMLPVFICLYLLEIIFHRKKKDAKHIVLGTVLGIAAFIFLMSPLVLFDFKHDFMNYKALTAFFGDRQTTVNLNILNSVSRTWPIYQDKLIGRYMTAENPLVTVVTSLLILLPLLLIAKKFFPLKDPLAKLEKNWPYVVLGVWLLGSMAGLSLYKQTIYDHYLGFISPAPYLLLGALVGFFHKYIRFGLAVLLIGVLGFLNLQKNPLLLSPNDQLYRTQQIDKYIISQSGGKPFNFALLSEHNYDAAYQFYLEIYDHQPLKVPMNKTDQLFVVCEDPICQPVGNPKYEIAAFGWSQVAWEKDIMGTKLFKLVHNQADPNLVKNR